MPLAPTTTTPLLSANSISLCPTAGRSHVAPSISPMARGSSFKIKRSKSPRPAGGSRIHLGGSSTDGSEGPAKMAASSMERCQMATHPGARHTRLETLCVFYSWDKNAHYGDAEICTSQIDEECLTTADARECVKYRS